MEPMSHTRTRWLNDFSVLTYDYSSSNPKAKLVRALARKKERYATRQFVIEGVRLIEEAVNAKVMPVLVLHTTQDEDDARARELLKRLRAMTPEVFDVSDAVMKEISTTETPPGIVAVVPFIELPMSVQPQFVLILDSVRDPGNVGTILRSARGAGVDVFSLRRAPPIRTTTRSCARRWAHICCAVSRRILGTNPETVDSIPRVYLADAHGEIIYSQADWSRPVALIVGGEAEGASERSAKIATARVTIPMHGGTESLNAAMATTVLLFQAANAK